MNAKTSASRRCGTRWCCRTLLTATITSLGRSGLVVRHVDDQHPASGFRHRVGRILELGLAVADGDEVGAGDAEFVGQVALDRVGAALRELLVVRLAAGGVGVTRD